MANTFAMTGLLIMLSLMGESVFAADVGIVQAATLALFFAFSGNARSLILNQDSGVTSKSVLSNRLVLFVPLGITAYWLSSMMGNVPQGLAVVLIVRRAVEWFDEIYLSEMEHLDNKKAAFKYITLQVLLLIFALTWLLLAFPFPFLGLWLWALLPLLLSTKFYYKKLPKLSELFVVGISKKLLPHLGSSMIIGVAIYIFRLLIVMTTGKSTAGDLFTAFAIGGVLGSVFANAIGPSLAFHQKQNLHYKIPVAIKLLLILFTSVGLMLVFQSTFTINLLEVLGKTPLFWQSTGLSMIAGTIMVFAQMIRYRLLQHHQEQDLFGPDVIINILIIAAIPFGYSLFGLKMMSGLYLLSAVLAYLFYASYELSEVLKSHNASLVTRKLKIAIAIFVLLPVFFQINGGIFDNTAMIFDTKSSVSLLPIPISMLGCLLGILFLGNYQQARMSFTFIFTTFILMTFATIISTGETPRLEESKFIFLIQFIMPMFGLVLGQFFYSQKDGTTLKDLAKVFLCILLGIMFVQLALTWAKGQFLLVPSLYFFSIYQHLEYVPMIFTSAYFFTLIGLWALPKYRIYLIVLTILMSVYVVAANSILAILIFYIGLFTFTWFQSNEGGSKRLKSVLSLSLLISSIYLFNSVNPVLNDNFIQLTEETQRVNTANPFLPLTATLEKKVTQWEYYFEGLMGGDSKSAFFGHTSRPDRQLHPSAYNYYLDFIYNFGLLPIIPLLWLIFYTLRQSVSFYCGAKYMNHKQGIIILTLSGIVFFLILIDNLFNVSLRQPYSGVFTFFMWGLLINKLNQNNLKGNNVISA